MRAARTLQRLTRAAVMAAVLSVLSPFVLPIGPVPVTLGLFAVWLTALLLPVREATAAVLLYLGVGAVGLPVFAGAVGGLAVLLGPSGGFLWGYLLLTPAVSLLSHRRSGADRLFRAVVLILSTVVCYLCGNAQYCAVMGTPFFASLAVTAQPFLLPDALKCIAAAAIARRMERAMGAYASPVPSAGGISVSVPSEGGSSEGGEDGSSSEPAP